MPWYILDSTLIQQAGRQGPWEHEMMHDLVICNMGHDKTNSSSSMQLTYCPRERQYLLSHRGEPCRFPLMSKASLGCFLVLHSKQQKRQNRIKTAVSSRIFTWESGPKRATFSLYVSSPEQGESLWAWTGGHSCSLQCHLTNILVQACNIKNNQTPQPFPIKVPVKSEQMQPITSHDHYFTNRAVNWWHHEANFIKHRCHTNLFALDTVNEWCTSIICPKFLLSSFSCASLDMLK